MDNQGSNTKTVWLAALSLAGNLVFSVTGFGGEPAWVVSSRTPVAKHNGRNKEEYPMAEQGKKEMVDLVVLADRGDRLRGVVYGHPSFKDGDKIVTSQIVSRRAGVVETRNTIYRLIKKD